MQKKQEHFSALRCSRLLFQTQFYLPRPWGTAIKLRILVNASSQYPETVKVF